MNTSDKKAYILDGLARFSARAIDISGKGSNIKRIDKISEEKLDELYQRVLELEGQTKTNQDKPRQTRQTKTNKTNKTNKTKTFRPGFYLYKTNFGTFNRRSTSCYAR
jgi:CRISPR/Cas system-associated protein Cas7 (RAMP superfamily)